MMNQNTLQNILAKGIMVLLLMLSMNSTKANGNCYKGRIIQVTEATILITIKDKGTNQSIPFAYFTISQGDSLIAQHMADSLGQIHLRVNSNAVINLHFSSLGYTPMELDSFRFSTSGSYNFKMKPASIQLDTFTIIEKKNNRIFRCGCEIVTTTMESLPVYKAEEVSLKPINAYPNPTLGRVTIVNLQDVSELLLMDVIGKILNRITVSGINQQIDLTNYPTGLYIIQYQREGQLKSLKLIKN
tara:strand:+ start:75861 stop:76592 length:732 start_codon:yes stop_codon:yes gene_type:complete